MPKTTLTEFECSMCNEKVVAVNLPVGWYEMYVTTDGGKFRRSNDLVFCEKHGDTICEVPTSLLHPNIVINRGLANPYAPVVPFIPVIKPELPDKPDDSYVYRPSLVPTIQTLELAPDPEEF